MFSLLISPAHYFLFVLGFVWIIFGVIQDLRSREISNWLNFSLIAFSLTYRAFYAVLYNDINFFLFGLGGVILFVGLAYALYYGKAFAGGDAKLLMGLGGILPFDALRDYVFLSSGFLLLLFGLGAAYTIVYTLLLVAKRWKPFASAFVKGIPNKTVWVLSIAGLVFFTAFILYVKMYAFLLWAAIFFLAMPFLYAYVKAVEKACMVKYVDPSQLTEGDWIMEDIHIGNKVIRKTVHGLSVSDILFLRKSKKKVLIREGVPFAPAFLLAYIGFFVFLRYFSF